MVNCSCFCHLVCQQLVTSLPVLQPVVMQVRGITIVLYLDDSMVVVKDSENMAVAISVHVQQVLIASGLIVNCEKHRLLTEVIN